MPLPRWKSFLHLSTRLSNLYRFNSVNIAVTLKDLLYLKKNFNTFHIPWPNLIKCASCEIVPQGHIIKTQAKTFKQPHFHRHRTRVKTPCQHVTSIEYIYTYTQRLLVVLGQQRSIFHHYKISNFTVTHCQYSSVLLTTYNGEVGNFIMAKNWYLLFYISIFGFRRQLKTFLYKLAFDPF